MLELYHAEPVAHSMKVLLCLKEKQIDFVSHYVDLLRFEQHRPEFLAINPNGQVPVLVHDGAIITESTVINGYLEDVFPKVRLRPEDPVQCARMRIWNKFLDEYFCPALSMIGWHTLVRQVAQRLKGPRLEEMLARIPVKEQRDRWATVAGSSFSEEELNDSRRRIGVAVERMERFLQKSHWVAGPTYSLADVNSYALVVGVPRFFPEFMRPRTSEWLEEMNQRPAVKAALAMPNKVSEVLRAVGD